MTEPQQCRCTGTDAGLNACANCPTPWPDLPGANRIVPRFTTRPVTPEMEHAATERARQAAADSEKTAEWIAEHSSPHPVEARLAHLQATGEAAGRLFTRTTDERDQLRAAITRVRQLHQPTGVVAAAEAGVEPDCAVCGPNRWPCPTYEAVTEPESAPGPAATEATERETTTRVFAALHRSVEQDVSRVIALYERWLAAGPPPLGTLMSRWWDARLVELHDAIRPSAE